MSEMKVEYWDGGLKVYELEAIKRIAEAFSPKELLSNNEKGKKLKSFDQLKSLSSKPGMWPWKGYAGFRLISEKGHEGEFDLVIVTHYNVIIVELKHWNGELTESHGQWLLNGQIKGNSAVSVTRNKVYTLTNKIERCGRNFTSFKNNTFKRPKVDFLVVLTGTANSKNLPEIEKQHVLSLNDFIELSDEYKFNAIFKPHPDANKALNKDFQVFDSIFSREATKPKRLIVNGYAAEEKIYPPEGVTSVYTEFNSQNIDNRNDSALIRQWNFKLFNDPLCHTQETRFAILSHEKDVLTKIKLENEELYLECLRPLSHIEKDNVTSEYCEVYELPSQYSRYNDYMSKTEEFSTPETRVAIVKTILKHFSELHTVHIAHRDIGDHSIWISPSQKIMLSNFMSAYHQTIKTVGERRSIISTALIKLPEDRTGLDSSPYKRDVYMLGVLTYLLLKGKRLSPANINDIEIQINEEHDWFAEVYKKAVNCDPTKRFDNATDFFLALSKSEPSLPQGTFYDATLLDKYKKKISLYKVYPDDKVVTSDENKEVYISDDRIVKVWNNVNYSSDQKITMQCLMFFEIIEQIKTSSLEFLPNIIDYGLTHKSELFIVQKFIEGITLDKLFETIEVSASEIVLKLISIISRLHDINLSHGDLKPEHVIVSKNETGVMEFSIIDIPDFSLSCQNLYNTKYGPANIDNCPKKTRDIFAVIRMSCEILGLNWDDPLSEKFVETCEAIKLEKTNNDGFLSIDRFSDAINMDLKRSSASDTLSLKLSKRNLEEKCLSLLPDNNETFLCFEKSKRGNSLVDVYLQAVNGNIKLIYDYLDKKVVWVGKPIENNANWIKEKAQLCYNLRLDIYDEQSDNFEDVTQFINNDESIFEIIKLIITNTIEVAGDASESSIENTVINEDEFISVTQEVDNATEQNVRPISTRSIWKALLETETEALPSIEVAAPPRSDHARNEYILEYDSTSDILELFDNDDEVTLVKLVDDSEITLGTLNLKRSTAKEIRINAMKRSVEIGEVLYMRTRKDKASYNRRKKAMERILEGKSIIPDLVSYFDSVISMPVKEYNIEITVEQFNRYDRVDDHGNNISLNDDQREAFRQLLTNGPISLLQGPPGTGKTEFISAFIHFLIEQNYASNILLVSQSHEAVNTAVERIRKHCVRFGTELDFVRFSNRENSISENLRDIYSKNIIESKLQSFKTEMYERVASLIPVLGIDKDFGMDVLDFEFKIKKNLKAYQKMILGSTEDGDSNTNEQTRSNISQAAENLFTRTMLDIENRFQLQIDCSDIDEIITKVESFINAKHRVTGRDLSKINRLIATANDFKERLATLPPSYDEFLARSRTIVCGTCVGMGLHHLGINEIKYDWVIIDEAARSMSSELAIAMQSANRILLVGDHKQLPPLYHNEHRKALLRKLSVPRSTKAAKQVFLSDFEKAFISQYGKAVGRTLCTQYRMAPPIGQLVSDVFYDKTLKTGKRNIPNFYESGPLLLRSTVTWIDTTSKGKDSFSKDDGTSLSNKEEVDQVLSLLKSIETDDGFFNSLSSTVKEGEAAIGVIAMYSAQKKLIRKRFNEKKWRDGFKELVKIDTVDSYQGKENRIIILSITRNTPDGSPGFLREANRINVAISRAMDRLVIVGAVNFWKFCNTQTPLGDVVEYIHNHSSNDYQIVACNSLERGCK